MGYRVVDPDEVSPTPDRPCERRDVTEPAGLSELAMNRYRAHPGEQIPTKYHSHEQQEEVFYVLRGTMAVETPERTYEVPAGQLFTADPGSPHRAYNPGESDDPLEVLAIGAPPVEGDAVRYEP